MATIAIQHCHSCDGRHEDLEVREYATEQRGPWTHWYSCPRSGDPVPLALVSTPQGTAEVNHEIVEALLQAQQDGAYMVCVFRHDGTLLHLQRRTENFRHDWFAAAARLLKEDLEGETGPPPAAELPEAPELLPRVNLFAEEGKGE